MTAKLLAGKIPCFVQQEVRELVVHSDCYDFAKDMAVDNVGVSRSQTEEDSDLEAQQSLPEVSDPSIRDPLCRLATNKDGKGVQGKWRLIAAIILCTLFMV